MNPYLSFVNDYGRLLREGKGLPLGVRPPCARPAVNPSSPRALIFSPHPDDECIIGALPLRLLRQAGFQVSNVAVTQGSKVARQAARWAELQQACDYLGYDLIATSSTGLLNVNAKTRATDPIFWSESVSVIVKILQDTKPSVIFFPHEHDWNSSHIGTHWLVVDALRQIGPSFECFAIETEYWGQNAQPNLMVESSGEDVADLVTGTSFHVGEVTRNPFHLFLPAWMQDNVRRGSELVGGQGQAAPNFTFATLYRLRRWNGSALVEVQAGGKALPYQTSPFTLFPEDHHVS